MNTTEKSNKKSITKTITSRIYLAMSIYPVIWPIKFAKIVKIITNGALLELRNIEPGPDQFPENFHFSQTI